MRVEQWHSKEFYGGNLYSVTTTVGYQRIDGKVKCVYFNQKKELLKENYTLIDYVKEKNS